MVPEFRAVIESVGASQADGSPDIRVAFPRFAAPDANAAMDQLFDAFPDHEPALLSESYDEWEFRLHWKSYPETFVDPGVRMAAAAVFELTPSAFGSYHEIHRWGGRDVVISMVHAWALLAPALAIRRGGGETLPWVVHVDDHTDLMAPMMEPSGTPGLLRDSVFGATLEIGSPESVAAAIRRGIVSKGNFLTAYLLACPGCAAVHVGASLNEREFPLSREERVFVLGGSAFKGTGFRLENPAEQGHGMFRQTSSVPVALPVPERGGVWLDIDLDYFCNRYNGDSDRRSQLAQPDEQSKVMDRVESFLAELSEATWLPRIEAVSIAVSPGFFPSDQWACVIPAIRNGIQAALES